MAAWFFVFLAGILIIGSALILLRTAKIPRLPEHAKDRAERQDEGGG
ncbi:hypothetical protein [Methylotuvimicrobium sp.]|jgi:hypothetical protein